MVDSSILQTIFHFLYYWTTALVHLLYSTVGLIFSNWKITAGVLFGVFIIFKVFIDK